MFQVEAAQRLLAKPLSKAQEAAMATRLKYFGAQYGYTFSMEGGYPSIDNKVIEVQAQSTDDGKVEIFVLPSMHIDPEGQEELGSFVIELDDMKARASKKLGEGIQKIRKANKQLLDHLASE